ncbi:MAG: GntR family transcriptional regulator, partial [Ilumatobacteraceae bacterium]
RQTVAAGEALPSEESLAETLGASRPAIREALIRMEANGLVRRHHGAGTFANPAALDMPVRLDNDIDFADRLSAVGFTVDVELLEAGVVAIDEAGSVAMEFDVGTRALRTVKRWRADGVIVVTAIDHVPLDRRTVDDDALAAAGRPLRQLSAEMGIGRADWLCTWPSAVEIDDDVARRLEYSVGRAALCVEQVGVERHGRRVFHALEHHRPGMVEYGLIRTVTH